LLRLQQAPQHISNALCSDDEISRGHFGSLGKQPGGMGYVYGDYQRLQQLMRQIIAHHAQVTTALHESNERL
jgi:hypothetical protein